MQTHAWYSIQSHSWLRSKAICGLYKQKNWQNWVSWFHGKMILELAFILTGKIRTVGFSWLYRAWLWCCCADKNPSTHRKCGKIVKIMSLLVPATNCSDTLSRVLQLNSGIFVHVLPCILLIYFFWLIKVVNCFNAVALFCTDNSNEFTLIFYHCRKWNRLMKPCMPKIAPPITQIHYSIMKFTCTEEDLLQLH